MFGTREEETRYVLSVRSSHFDHVAQILRAKGISVREPQVKVGTQFLYVKLPSKELVKALEEMPEIVSIRPAPHYETEDLHGRNSRKIPNPPSIQRKEPRFSRTVRKGALFLLPKRIRPRGHQGVGGRR